MPLNILFLLGAPSFPWCSLIGRSESYLNGRFMHLPAINILLLFDTARAGRSIIMSGLRPRLVLATTALALSLFCSTALAAASGCPYSALWERVSGGFLRPWSGSAAVSNHMDAQRAAAAAIDFKAVRVRRGACTHEARAHAEPQPMWLSYGDMATLPNSMWSWVVPWSPVTPISPTGPARPSPPSSRTALLLPPQADLVTLMTTSQPTWPADFGNYGPLFIRLVRLLGGRRGGPPCGEAWGAPRGGRASWGWKENSWREEGPPDSGEGSSQG